MRQRRREHPSACLGSAALRQHPPGELSRGLGEEAGAFLERLDGTFSETPLDTLEELRNLVAVFACQTPQRALEHEAVGHAAQSLGVVAQSLGAVSGGRPAPRREKLDLIAQLLDALAKPV